MGDLRIDGLSECWYLNVGTEAIPSQRLRYGMILLQSSELNVLLLHAEQSEMRSSRTIEQRAGHLMVIRMSMDSIWSSRRGTSLIEVLVVMLILLIGIMTVIQMFPTGFGVVKAGESRTIATKLAQQELERWKNMSQNLPDGILPTSFDGTQLQRRR